MGDESLSTLDILRLAAEQKRHPASNLKDWNGHTRILGAGLLHPHSGPDNLSKKHKID